MKIKRIILTTLIVAFIVAVSPLAGQDGSSEALLKQAQDHMNLFHYDQAADYAKKACESDPNNWNAFFIAGKCFLKLKKTDDAERYLSKANSLNPQETDIQKALGSIYIGYAKAAQTNGQQAKKLEYQQKACHAYPGATKIWLSLFEQWWESGEYKKIKDEGDFLIKNTGNILSEGEDESLQQSILIVARAYYHDKDYAKTETFLNHASKIRVSNDEIYSLKRELKSHSDENIKKYLDKAYEQANRKQYAEAEKTLVELDKQPGARSGNIPEQIAEIRKILSFNQMKDDIEKLINSQDYEKALVNIEDGLGTLPENEWLTEKQKFVNDKIEEIEAKKSAEEQARHAAENKRKRLKREFEELKEAAEKSEKEGNFDEAIENLNKALKKNPKELSLKDKIKSLTEMSKAAKKRQNEYNSSLAELEDYKNKEDYENCIELAKNMLIEYPEHSETIVVTYTEACLAIENYKEAAKVVEPLADNKQYSAIYNISKGMAAYEAGDNEQASTYLDKVTLEKSKYKSLASKTLMIMFLVKIQWGIYLFIITLVVALSSKLKEGIKNHREASYQKKIERIKESGDYEKNVKFLEERLEKEDVGNLKLVMLLLAAGYQKTGEFEKAYSLINEYLKKDARNPMAKSIAGEAALALGETTPIALEHIQNLLKINESRTDVLLYLANTYMQQQQDHKLAQEYIAKAIVINPSNTEAIFYLAQTYINRQNYNNQSIKVFERAIKANPDKPEYYGGLMENYRAVGNTEMVEKVREIIEQKFPDYFQQSAPQSQQDYYSDPYGTTNQQSYYDTLIPSQSNSNIESNSTLPNMDNLSEQPSLSNQPSTANSFSNIGTMKAEEKSSTDYAVSEAQQQSYFEQAQQPINQQTYFNQPQQQDYFSQMQQQDSNAYNDGPKATVSGTRKNSYFPDYDNIGSAELPSLDSLGEIPTPTAEDLKPTLPNLDLPSSPAPKKASQPQISGPKKNCPHCGAVNSANEYYCTSCGKPF